MIYSDRKKTAIVEILNLDITISTKIFDGDDEKVECQYYVLFYLFVVVVVVIVVLLSYWYSIMEYIFYLKDIVLIFIVPRCGLIVPNCTEKVATAHQ